MTVDNDNVRKGQKHVHVSEMRQSLGLFSVTFQDPYASCFSCWRPLLLNLWSYLPTTEEHPCLTSTAFASTGSSTALLLQTGSVHRTLCGKNCLQRVKEDISLSISDCANHCEDRHDPQPVKHSNQWVRCMPTYLVLQRPSSNMPDCGTWSPRINSHRRQLYVYCKNHCSVVSTKHNRPSGRLCWGSVGLELTACQWADCQLQ